MASSRLQLNVRAYKPYDTKLNFFCIFSSIAEVWNQINFLPEAAVAPKPVNDGWLTNPTREIWHERG